MAATATKKPRQKSLARLGETMRKGEAWITPNQAASVVCRLKGQSGFKPQMQQGQSQVGLYYQGFTRQASSFV